MSRNISFQNMINEKQINKFSENNVFEDAILGEKYSQFEDTKIDMSFTMIGFYFDSKGKHISKRKKRGISPYYCLSAILLSESLARSLARLFLIYRHILVANRYGYFSKHVGA